MWFGRHQALAMCSCSEKRNHGLSAKLLLTLLLTEKKGLSDVLMTFCFLFSYFTLRSKGGAKIGIVL